MTTPLSTYRGGEKRVTSSIMAAFERIDPALVRDILAGAAGAGDELQAVNFENQRWGVNLPPATHRRMRRGRSRGRRASPDAVRANTGSTAGQVGFRA